MASWEFGLLNQTTNMIQVTMYLYPIIHANSEVMATVTFDAGERTYSADVNPVRAINGPLSGPGEELEAPMQDEWDSFIEDCRFVIKEAGFTIIDSTRREESKESGCVLTFGIGDTPCGTIAFNLRISGHPFNASFPEESKEIVLEYFKEGKILDGTATKAGIDFQVEKITIGSVTADSWNEAIHRLYDVMKQVKAENRQSSL